MPYNLIVTPEALQALNGLKFNYWIGKMGNMVVADRIHNWFWDTMPKIEETPFSFGEPWDNLPVLAKAGYRRALYNDYHVAVLFKVYPDNSISVDFVYDQRQKRVSHKGRPLR